jgi:hypothetical protein
MRIKQGDLFPFEYVLTYDDSTPIDLSGATVTITTILDEASSPTVDAETCSITDAINGVIRYSWQSGETDVTGMYRIEFVITFNSGSTLTVPSGDVLWLLIVASTHPPVVTP